MSVRRAVFLSSNKPLHNKQQVLRRMRRRQQVLEQHSLSVLERLNQTRDRAEMSKLSRELSYLSKNILDIQETIDHLDTYMMFSEVPDDELEL